MVQRNRRHRITYFVDSQQSQHGHRLGLNSLALDTKDRGNGSVLFSAGRDGVISAWDQNVALANKQSQPMDDVQNPSNRTTFRKEIQAHTHWVNAILMANFNEALVSCSSDTTVKMWRPYSDSPVESIGDHTDYVKCLAIPHQSSTWVASGGLDRKIKLWDLSGKGEQMAIDVSRGTADPKGSVYALACGSNIVASGGPESVVRLWDSRTGKGITKFIGHTDNVRAILINESGDTLLTASSDTTIKLWSVRDGRCHQTYNMHSHSVWSLYSDSDNFSTFYAGDRGGLVTKTDLRGARVGQSGICAAVCRENGLINDIVVAPDQYLWTATARSHINKWVCLFSL